MHTKFMSANLKGRHHSEDLGVLWEDNIITNLRKIWWAPVVMVMNIKRWRIS